MPNTVGFLENNFQNVILVVKRQHSWKEDSQVFYRLKASENYFLESYIYLLSVTQLRIGKLRPAKLDI